MRQTLDGKLVNGISASCCVKVVYFSLNVLEKISLRCKFVSIVSYCLVNCAVDFQLKHDGLFKSRRMLTTDNELAPEIDLLLSLTRFIFGKGQCIQPAVGF